MQVRFLALLSGLRIQYCCELWCRSQMWLRSGVAMAVSQVGGYSSDWTPCLGTSMCRGCGPRKRQKDQNKTKKKKLLVSIKGKVTI